MVDALKNLANKTFQKVATPFIGVLKDSKFLKEGVLTPEEFVIAGDQLTHKCPTWRYLHYLINQNLVGNQVCLIKEMQTYLLKNNT
jgi:hypothetical protein